MILIFTEIIFLIVENVRKLYTKIEFFLQDTTYFLTFEFVLFLSVRIIAILNKIENLFEFLLENHTDSFYVNCENKLFFTTCVT